MQQTAGRANDHIWICCHHSELLIKALTTDDN